MTTVLGTFLLLRIVNEVHELSISCLNLVIGLGLGLAIDYTLFLLTRYREEMERSGPGAKALRDTMATAGRTVVFVRRQASKEMPANLRRLRERLQART